MAVQFFNPGDAVAERFVTKARAPLNGRAHLSAEPAEGACPICGSTKIYRRKLCKGCYRSFPPGYVIPGIIEAHGDHGA